MRLSHTCVLIALALCLALANLTGCGAAGRTAHQTGAAPTPTVNLKGATTPGPAPTPEIPPYAFPASWQKVSGPLDTGKQVGYDFAPTNQQIGYACAYNPTPFNATTDGGATWRPVPGAPFSSCGAVFVDQQDPNDVFVTQSVPFPPNPPQTQDQLWRSRDGGATWQKLGMITGTGMPLGYANLAVVGSRVISSVYVNGEGGLANSLYVSDDGGMTWRPFAQSVASQQYQLSQFVTAGSTIYIQGVRSNGASGCMPQSRVARRTAFAGCLPQSGVTRSSAMAGYRRRVALSGSPVNSELYWQSTDGGATWTRAWANSALPNGLPTFVRAANGSGFYAVAITATNIYDGGNANDATLSWSSDGGATWTHLPSMRGLEGGYVIGGGFMPVIAPDGTVFAAADHAGLGYGDDAGVFVIHPTAAAPAWTPLAPGGVQFRLSTTTSTGVRLWGNGATNDDQYFQYVDVP